MLLEPGSSHRWCFPLRENRTPTQTPFMLRLLCVAVVPELSSPRAPEPAKGNAFCLNVHNWKRHLPSPPSLLLLYTVYLFILKPAQLTWDWVFPKGDFENIQCSAFIWQNVLLMFLYGSCLVIFGSVLSRVFFNLFTECSVSWNQAFHFYWIVFHLIVDFHQTLIYCSWNVNCLKSKLTTSWFTYI